MTCMCEHCNKSFETKRQKRFCTQRCYWDHPRSKEHNEKLLNNLRKKNGSSSGMKGRCHSEETKKLISLKTQEGMTTEICQRIAERQTGSNNARWIVDRTRLKGLGPYRGLDTNQLAKWRKSVYERDNFTCVVCKQVGGKLNADHIKPVKLFPELVFDLENGRTLCYECHKKTNTFCGRVRKLTREDF